MKYDLVIVNELNNNIEEFLNLARKTKLIAFDIESSGLDPFNDDMLLLQFAALSDGKPVVYVIMARAFDNTLQTAINSLTNEAGMLFLAHNAKFDNKFLLHNYKIEINTVWDTQITEASLTLGKNYRTSLEKVAERRFGISLEKETRNKFIGMSPDSNFTDEQIHYAARDVAILFRLYEEQKREVKELGLEKVVELENRLVPVTAKLELNGVKLDTQSWSEVIDTSEKELLNILNKLYKIVGFNRPVQSSFLEESRVKIKQLVQTMNLNHAGTVLDYLYKLGYKDVENTSAQTLQALKGDFPEFMLEYRKRNKLLTTYLWTMADRINPTTGRIHPDYNQLPTFDSKRNRTFGTTTGRFSSNFQQIPRDNRLRNCFVAREGYKIITADYSGVEYRIVANVSKDKNLVDFFLSDMNDIHAYSASLIYEVPVSKVKKSQRQICKNINYAYIYGATAKGLAWRYNVDLEIMEHAFKQYERSFPQVVVTMEKFARYATQTGTIRDAIGRIKFFDLEKQNEWDISRKAKNFPIQATSASQMKYAMYKLYKEFKEPDVYFYGTFHDEIVLEVREEIAEEIGERQAKIMQECAGIICPGPVPYLVDYEIADYWLK